MTSLSLALLMVSYFHFHNFTRPTTTGHSVQNRTFALEAGRTRVACERFARYYQRYRSLNWWLKATKRLITDASCCTLASSSEASFYADSLSASVPPTRFAVTGLLGFAYGQR